MNNHLRTKGNTQLNVAVNYVKIAPKKIEIVYTIRVLCTALSAICRLHDCWNNNNNSFAFYCNLWCATESVADPIKRVERTQNAMA